MSAQITESRPRTQVKSAPVQSNRRGRNAPRTQVKTTNTTGATDKATINSTIQKTNPFSSISSKSSTVSVEKWGKGKNSSLEGILRNQGYSLKEIYSKDANGKNMVDKVASANGLKNANLIQPGQKLDVPTKENSASISTADLKNGEMQTAKVSTGETAIKATSGKDQDGVNRTNVATQNKDADARIRSESTVGEGGRIDTSVAREGDQVNAQSTVLSKDGSSRTAVDTVAKNDSSSVTVRDIDSNKNLNANSSADSVVVTNEGSNAKNTGTTTIDISEGSQDGIFESGARRVAGWFGFNGEEAKTGSATGATDVQVKRDSEGATTVTANVNGKRTTIGQTAGDSDDTWFERAGEGVDDAFRWVGGLFNREQASTGKIR